MNYGRKHKLTTPKDLLIAMVSIKHYIASFFVVALFQSMGIYCRESLGLQHLIDYLDFNQVPESVYLGLLSNGTDPQLTDLEMGICFQYDALNDPRCQFYSDCCAMSPPRVREQLPEWTFSCHNGYYVVDKCPGSTEDDGLRSLCENTEHLSGEGKNLFYLGLSIFLKTIVF